MISMAMARFQGLVLFLHFSSKILNILLSFFDSSRFKTAAFLSNKFPEPFSFFRDEFEKYAKDTFPANMASHAMEMFALMDLNADGKIQKDEFVKAYMIDEL